MRVITYYCTTRKRSEKQHQLGGQHSTTRSRGLNGIGAVLQELRNMGDTIVRRLMLLIVVNQQGIDVVSLYTKERLTQFWRQHVGYTFKLQWEMQPLSENPKSVAWLGQKRICLVRKLKEQVSKLIAYLFMPILFTYSIERASTGVALQFP
jgi:hypothetical protein